MLRTRLRSLAVVLAVAVSLGVAHDTQSAESDTARVIQSQVEEIRSSKGLRIGDARIASETVLPEFYESRQFRAAWTDPGQVDQFLQVIRGIDADGLVPNDYHLAEIERRRDAGASDRTLSPPEAAALDVLLTDSLIRLVYHLSFGKVDPEQLDPNWNLAREIQSGDPAMTIQRMIDSPCIATEIDGFRPQHTDYRRQKAALAGYRSLQAAGGWEPVPPGPTLRMGMTDDRVAPLRRRLTVTGDLPSTAAQSMVFDEPLEQAVIHFQARHRLETDGAVGPGTTAAMNVPVDQRIAQIRANLERGRWFLHQVGDDFVLVDIAGFELFLFRGGQPIWTTRVQVGKPARKTPVTRSEIEYLVLNPTWTVPPGILANDKLPAIRRDPSYLKKHNIKVIDRAGKVVNPRSINWSGYTGRGFPYQLRQDPGPDNALGRIKFIFPNPHLVYLHDTPSKVLFGRTNRAFSSGCIRVQNPFDLATFLLEGTTNWDRKALMRAVDTKKTQTVFLAKPVPVLLLYWTVSVADDGTVSFKPDVYGRDPALVAALDGAFRFRQRPVAGRDKL